MIVVFIGFCKGIIQICVDWSGRCETPEGLAGQVRPRSGARRLSARPSESEQPSAEINLAC